MSQSAELLCRVSFPHLGQIEDDMYGAEILCKIAHQYKRVQAPTAKIRAIRVD
jgi:hypothetical protein